MCQYSPSSRESGLQVKEWFLNCEISLTATKVGADYLLILAGGSKPHIGACALTQPYMAGSAAKQSASLSLLERCGHRDGELAARAARLFFRESGKEACVVCGIHFDDLDQAQIQNVLTLCDGMIQRLVRKISS